ncbi:hypothetical protein FQN54_002563 [Arachnomyces sp. PD_36]|nr:hypothetical protein FQN54_002563 [Arachnomyces sp. PD_36]
MLSLRAFTRSVPRTISRSFAAPSTVRPLSTIPKPSFLQSSWKLASRPSYAAFSTSRARYEPAGQVDVELSAKFQDEMSLENESRDPNQRPEDVQYFLDNGPWEIQDKPGEEEVVLTRKFGDETIRVAFTVADLQNLSESEELNDDALEDEIEGLEDAQSRGAVNKGGRDGNIKVAPEDRVAPSDQEGAEEAFEDENEPSYPVRVNVTIEKPGKGAVHVETVAQDGLIQIENVSYFAKSELANAQTAEKEWSRQSLYSGPPFGNLDEDLQVLLERYLDERGIDTGLASFIPDYIDFKEQREYVGWLSNLKKFVDA